MLQEELKKLNKYKIITLIGCVGFIVLCSFIFIRIMILCGDKSYIKLALVLFLTSFLIPIFLYKKFMAKTEEIFAPYVLSNFPNWKLIVSRKDKANTEKQWPQYILPFKSLLSSLVIPSNYRGTLHITDAFQNESGNQKIIQVRYEDEGSSRGEKPAFNATLVIRETNKNVNATTCFKNNCYPHGTPGRIMKEKYNSELPKIELPAAKAAKFDVYGNKENISEKLATPELFSALHTIQEQLDLPYVKSVFYKQYVIFVLRHKEQDWRSYGTFFVRLPVFAGIKPDLLQKAVANFFVLTDLADKAPDFTKNI